MKQKIPKSILIIDDDPLVKKVLLDFLKLAGVKKIVMVGTGRDALAKIVSEKFDMALVDYKLPDIDGIELIKHIKRFKRHIPKRIIAITGEISLLVHQNLKNAGAAHVIIKPISQEKINFILSL